MLPSFQTFDKELHVPLDWIFLWLLGITAGVRLFYAIRLRSLPDGIYASLMLSVTFLIWVYPSEHQWILAAGIWLIWGFIPGLSSLLIERWVSQQCYAPAILLAKINALLMPFVGHSQQAAYLAALQHAQQGHMEKAQGILKQDTMPNTPMGQVMVCHAWVMLSDWMAIVKRVEAMEDRALGKNPAMLLFYGRALGELGELNRLVSGFSKLERCLTKYPETTKATFKNQYRLFLFSYLGQLSRVEALLSGPLVHYSDALKQFWLAVTESAAGHHETAQQRYQTLLESGTPDIVRRVEQRLVQRTPPQAQGILNIAAKAQLTEIEQAFDYAQHHGCPTQPPPLKQAKMTLALMLLNSVFFIAELPGGSENAVNLYDLGALVPSIWWTHEWWRLVTVHFLHYGPVHLVLNLFTLWVFGPFVESVLGSRKYLLCYLASGILAGVLMVALAALFPTNPQLHFMAVGASGCIFGVLGCQLAIFFKRWRRHQNILAKKRFILLLGILGIQVVFDLITPHVSVAMHGFGVVIGWGLCMLVYQPTESINTAPRGK